MTVAKSEPVGFLPGCAGVEYVVYIREVGLEIRYCHEKDAICASVKVADGGLATGANCICPNGIGVVVGASPFSAKQSCRVT